MVIEPIMKSSESNIYFREIKGMGGVKLFFTSLFFFFIFMMQSMSSLAEEKRAELFAGWQKAVTRTYDWVD